MGKFKFLFTALVLIGLLALIELYYPKPVSWQVNLSSAETTPFGISYLKESLPDLFSPTQILQSRESFYLMEQSSPSSPSSKGYLTICKDFIQGKEDFQVMMEKLDNGSTILVSAFGFNELLEDSLGFTITDEIVKDLYPEGLIPKEDSTYLRMIFPSLIEKFTYRRMDAPYSFTIDDSEVWEILMENEEGKPVAIARNLGEGRLILSCTPLIFSNYYMIYTESYKASAALLSQLPESSLHWTEYYSRGRGEPQTPLRYILGTAPLRWSYYLTIFAVIAFVLFEAKRKQRPIPIINVPRNESLDFIKTVGNLYYERNDHKNIAEKKIQYLLEYIRSHYHLSTSHITDPEFMEQIAHKSGKPLLNVEGLFNMIDILQKKQNIHPDELRMLNDKIEAFLKP